MACVILSWHLLSTAGWFFYQPVDSGVDIKRVLYGNANWRQEPERFF
jgi:hypothetical protein